MDEQDAAFTDCSEAERIRRTAGLVGLKWYRYQLLDKALLTPADEAMVLAACRRLLFGASPAKGGR
jgi:hypothetical protein